ncbi:hypothetical protein P7K49_008920 [Saguinus oedipus]|uniref:Uncharacterized protein n=1 Tax=Saguinus oedipus TaxID=9490 RepID=A0ABQ9W0R3_SAGOE|nr:hypothetical protein P7K49_008920 [Saguinus oedipus]
MSVCCSLHLPSGCSGTSTLSLNLMEESLAGAVMLTARRRLGFSWFECPSADRTHYKGGLVPFIEETAFAGVIQEIQTETVLCTSSCKPLRPHFSFPTATEARVSPLQKLMESTFNKRLHAHEVSTASVQARVVLELWL